jgi:pimeloyl-ACP methyl ester carboxylesterase
MISVDSARRLVEAGLQWKPVERDTFMIPGASMDERVFVVSELTALVQPLAGIQHITFHGSSEWALDQVMLTDAVWLPSETQLREMLETYLPDQVFLLERGPEGYRCVVPSVRGNGRSYPSAEDAYAAALLHLLSSSQS